MYYLNQQPGRCVTIEEEEYLFFSGYSYLGMSYVTAFIDLIKEGIDRYGLVFPSSRISNTRLSLYKSFEENLATLTGMEECISFSSGFLAGKTIAAVLNNHPHVFVSPLAHPAVTPEGKINDEPLLEWEERLLGFCHKEKPAEIVVIMDTIHTGTGTVNDTTFLNKIPPFVKVVCVVDDSHGIGLLGEHGEGMIGQLPRTENIEYILSCSLSKAFHLEGGVLCCSKAWASKIRQQPFYTGSTPIMPALAHTFLKAGDLYRKQRKKLLQNIHYLASKMMNNPYVNHFGLPIFVLPGSLTEEVFKPDHIIISSFGYPNPDYDKNNRVVLSALHTIADLDKVAASINKHT
jgi:7-keto-8-aminopelargonate synthetase-like enzyme